MRWYNKLKLVFRNYTRGFFVTILLYGMCMVSFVLIDKVLTEYIGNRYEVWQVEKSFAVNPYNTGYVHFIGRDMTQSVSDRLYEHMQSSDNIKCSGYILNQTLYTQDGDYIIAQMIQKELLGIGNIKISETERKYVESLSENERIVFLGCNYRGTYKEGDFLDYYDGDDISRIRIAGFLDKGSRWIHQEQLFGGSYGEWDQYTLDNTALVIAGSLEKELKTVASSRSNDIYLECESDKFTEVSDEIKNYCYKEGINVSVINYGDEITQKKEQSNILDDTVFIAAIMITILAIISVAASNIVYCLMNKENYAIMLANGMCKADIVWMIVAQNIIVIILAAVSTWNIRQKSVFGKIFAYKEVVSTGRLYEGLYVAHVNYMPVIFAVAVIILLFLSCIVPAVMINKTSLADMGMGRGNSW